MKPMKFLYITTFSFFVLCSSPAHAYLDPGTGSLIIQSIIGMIAAAVAAIGFYWSKVKFFLISLLGADSTDDDQT